MFSHGAEHPVPFTPSEEVPEPDDDPAIGEVDLPLLQQLIY